jgi:recombinational DNA repair protein (RecF pathway)
MRNVQEKVCGHCSITYKADRGYKHRDGKCVSLSHSSQESLTAETLPPRLAAQEDAPAQSTFQERLKKAINSATEQIIQEELKRYEEEIRGKTRVF